MKQLLGPLQATGLSTLNLHSTSSAPDVTSKQQTLFPRFVDVDLGVQCRITIKAPSDWRSVYTFHLFFNVYTSPHIIWESMLATRWSHKTLSVLQVWGRLYYDGKLHNRPQYYDSTWGKASWHRMELRRVYDGLFGIKLRSLHCVRRAEGGIEEAPYI